MNLRIQKQEKISNIYISYIYFINFKAFICVYPDIYQWIFVYNILFPYYIL